MVRVDTLSEFVDERVEGAFSLGGFLAVPLVHFEVAHQVAEVVGVQVVELGVEQLLDG